MSKGANVNARARDGVSPLYFAASDGAPLKVVQILLNAGADPWLRCLGKWTPLDMVRLMNFVGLVGVLEEAMARIPDKPETAGPFVREDGMKYPTAFLVRDWTSKSKPRVVRWPSSSS